MPGVFISYRRADSLPYTGRIYDHLKAILGAQNVFMDLTGIQLGSDFVETLQNAVNECQALIAVIGKDWKNVTNENGQKRLFDPQDFVRIEIETALHRGILIIPVLVGGASMPKAEDLPLELQNLVRKQAQTISDYTFEQDISRVVNALRAVIDVPNISNVSSLKERERTAHILALWFGFTLAELSANRSGVVSSRQAGQIRKQALRELLIGAGGFLFFGSLFIISLQNKNVLYISSQTGTQDLTFLLQICFGLPLLAASILLIIYIHQLIGSTKIEIIEGNDVVFRNKNKIKIGEKILFLSSTLAQPPEKILKGKFRAYYIHFFIQSILLSLEFIED